MSNASSAQSVNQLKQLGLVSSAAHKKPNNPNAGSPSLAPEIADAVEISPNAKEIGDLSRLDLKKMSPEELLQLTKKIFEKFDLNGDGKVSAREANKLGVPQETFARYDKDGDGAIGLREEFAPQFLRDLGSSGQISMTQCLSCMKEIGGVSLVMKGFLEIFGRVDLDKNGEVSAEEAQKLGIDGEKFKQWDANGDGKVSLFGEYLPKVVDDLRDQGVLNDREHRKLMNRIENAAKGEQEPEPELEVKPARNRRAEQRGEDRRSEDPIRIREHAERWLRGHALDRRSLEDLAGRLLRRKNSGAGSRSLPPRISLADLVEPGPLVYSGRVDAILAGSVLIPISEIGLSFSRSGGPGGQNVNKVESKVTLRFSLAQSPSVPPVLKQRAMTALASELTKAGEIVLQCDRSRSQWQNRADCLQKLRDLLQEAFRPPKMRRATKPTRSSKSKRMESKRKHGEKKRLRREKKGADPF